MNNQMIKQQRRSFLLGILALGSASALSGCGFELRKTPTFNFDTLCIVGSSNALTYLRKDLAQWSDVHITNNVAEAEVFLEVVSDKRQEIAVVQTSAGQVREIEMRGRLVFRLWVRGQDPLTGEAELEERREYSFSETQALAKEDEQILLNKDISKAFAAQLLRRLAAVRLDQYN